MSKVFIGGLNYRTSDGQLRDHFSQYGNISDAVVITDRESGRSRGFGFITYEEEDSAQRAVKEMNDEEFDGRRIRVDISSPGGGGDRRSGGYRSNGGGRNERGGDLGYRQY